MLIKIAKADTRKLLKTSYFLNDYESDTLFAMQNETAAYSLFTEPDIRDKKCFGCIKKRSNRNL